MSDLNLPWRVEKVSPQYFTEAFPWLVLDKWGVVIGRFDREDQACRAAVGGGSPPEISGGILTVDEARELANWKPDVGVRTEETYWCRRCGRECGPEGHEACS